VTGAARLLERERELAALDEALQPGAALGGRLVAIRGPAGIGKTRLLEHARSAATRAGLRVLTARGSALERSFAFGVVRQLFEAVVVRGDAADREEILQGSAALALPVFAGHPVDSAVQPAGDGSLSLLHGLYWLAANLAERQPLLIAVDDLQWCDTPSLEWLGYLVRRLEGTPIVVAVAFRPAEVAADPVLVDELTDDDAATLLRPAPLSLSAAERLAEAVLGAPPDQEFTDACLEASGGNPLLLGELLEGLAAEQVEPVKAEVARVQEIGPGAVSRSVRRRLSHLPAEARAFARALAVLGDGSGVDLVAELSGLSAGSAADAAHRLEEAEVVRTAPKLAFQHALVRDAVYLQVSPAERTEAHRRAARLLWERRQRAEQAAAHLLLTPRGGDPWAVAVLRAAASDALGRSSPAIAAVYLGRALDEPPEAEVRGELLFELGAAEALTRDPEAEVHLQEAQSLAADAATRAEITLTLARLLFWRHAAAEARALLETAIAELGEPHAAQRARLEAELAGMALSSPATHARVADRLARSVDPSDESVGGKMLLAFAAYRDTLRGEARARCVERATVALDGGALLAAELSPALVSAVLTLVYTDELELALRVSQEGRSLAEQHGAPASFALASAGVARVLHDMGRLLEAEAVGSVGLAACPATHAVARAYAAGSVVKVLVKRGDLEGAAAALAEAGLDSGHVPVSLHAADPLNALGALHLAQGDATAALDDFLAIRDLVEPAQCHNPAVAAWRSGAALALLQLGRRGGAHAVPRCEVELARGWGAPPPLGRSPRARRRGAALALLQLGRRDEALALARDEVELSRAWGAPTAIGRSLRALGLVEGGKKGLELLEEATVVLRESPAAYELLETELELGAALRRGNQRSRARTLLRACLERAERTGAGLLARRARDELLATGARPRRLVVTGVEALTASERRVATMAAEGMTNRDIAQALFVTTKTVEMHLAHVFDKLEIRSRTELAAALASAADASEGTETAPPAPLR
jgi:DNA-binding CsgD family transcriptional regulator/tetratricopeptide (TPR) repeat protein